MADFRLFRLGTTTTTEIPDSSAQIERSLQRQFEDNLEVLLDIHSLATEFTTARIHSGRINRLDLNENNCRVIIKYKRAVNGNVINQAQSPRRAKKANLTLLSEPSLVERTTQS